jgi:hypothetical protein
MSIRRLEMKAISRGQIKRAKQSEVLAKEEVKTASSAISKIKKEVQKL